MQFVNKAVVPADRESLWNFLMDIPKVGSCLPGVEEVHEVGDGKYEGTFKVRVGPISLSFTGLMTITEQDKQNWKAVMRAEGADRRAGGAVKSTMSMQLNQLGPKETELVVTTDAVVMGKIGEFGQPVMRKKADRMISEFAENVSRRVGAG